MEGSEKVRLQSAIMPLKKHEYSTGFPEFSSPWCLRAREDAEGKWGSGAAGVGGGVGGGNAPERRPKRRGPEHSGELEVLERIDHRVEH
jgi:hypothetical protein